MDDRARELAERFLPLAGSVARAYVRAHPRLKDEIRSAAQLGLAVAAEKYDESTTADFSCYARKVIVNAILREIRDSRPLGYRQSRDRDQAPFTFSLSPALESQARARGTQPGDALETSEAFELLLKRFRAGHRPLLRLLFEEDLSITEAAEVLGLTRAEALQLYSHALAGIGTRERPKRRRVVIVPDSIPA